MEERELNLVVAGAVEIVLILVQASGLIRAGSETPVRY